MRTLIRRGALVVAAGALLGASASTASAATWEQLSRASGVYGVGSIASPSVPGPASDSGIFGLYGQADATGPHGFMRNIFTDRTTPLAAAGRPLAMDKAEKLVLSSAPVGSATRFTIGPIGDAGGATVATVAGGTAALGGDGTKVVYSGSTGSTSLFDVATGASSTVVATPLKLTKYSISDDGTVIAGATATMGLVIAGGKLSATPYPASVSPSGKSIFWVDSAKHVLVTRTLADGAEHTMPLPAALGTAPQVVWVDADGGNVALAPSSTTVSGKRTAPTGNAEAVSVADGSWIKFGGTLARSLYDPVTGTAGGNVSISRNGRFATVGLNEQVALVTLESTLPGAGNSASPSTYFAGAGAVRCGTTGSFTGYLAQPAAWFPRPKHGTARIIADGTVIREATSETPQLPGPGAVDDPNFTVTIPAAAKNVVFEWTVVDGIGQTLKETYPLQGC